MTRFFSRPRSRAGSGRRTARRAATNRRVIFLYHRVAAPRTDPFRLAVPPELFHDHLEILMSRSRLVALDEILRGDADDPGFRTSITFDDGYVDNLAVASPLLVEAGVPATFFVCTGSLGDVRGFWWDRLASAIAATDAPSTALEDLDGVAPIGDLTSDDTRTRATLAIAARLQPMHPVPRARLLEEIEARLPAREGRRREDHPIVDEAGLRALGSQPLTRLGAHTHGHPMLSRLSRDEQLGEIARSASTIADITGTRPRYLAYPYGGEADYNRDSCLAARDAGMRAAFGNHGGRFDPAREPFRVPRFYVPPLEADRFRAWLDGILAR